LDIDPDPGFDSAKKPGAGPDLMNLNPKYTGL